MHFVVVIFLLVALAAVSILLLGGWVILSVLRFIFGGIFGSKRSGPNGQRLPRMLATVRCVRAGCHADNPAPAHFCRRCGVSLQGQRQPMRRVAMW
jgi:hypothetical protein